jgi:hypothetical protein
MGRALYDGLNTALGSGKINYEAGGFNHNGTYAGGSSNSSGRITVGTNTTGNTSGGLFHELFHGYQHHSNHWATNATWNDNLANNEVEAWLAHYYYVQNNASTEGHWVNTFGDTSLGDALENLSNFVSINGQLTGGASAARDAVERVRLQLAHQGYLSINRGINNPQDVAATFSNMGKLFGGCAED